MLTAVKLVSKKPAVINVQHFTSAKPGTNAKLGEEKIGAFPPLSCHCLTFCIAPSPDKHIIINANTLTVGGIFVTVFCVKPIHFES